RYVSAADVLEGRDPPGFIENKIALLGATATGLVDLLTTARGERIPGIEIHAQVLENIVDGSLLSRPAWARPIEALAFALAALLVVFGLPRLAARRSSSIPLRTQGATDRRRRSRSLPRPSLAIPLVCSGVLAAAGVSAYFWGHVLLDPATPIAGITALYGLMLSVTLVATDFQRREIAARLATERETAARVAGELEAARRIQTGILPSPESVLKHERRVGIFAHMRPALEVGGDLYDFFLLPDDKLFVMAGDVSGKGLPAAMFMAVSKALVKSSTLRATTGLDLLMTAFNAEISRENPEQLFVTVIALVIDLRTGEVEYCNAGHEPPLLARRSGELVVVNEGGGPPLCVMDDFPYKQARITLEPGDMLVLMSDGITEAMNSDGALYGRDRLNPLLAAQGGRGADAAALGHEILAAVKAFEASAEPADDQTLVIVSWRGAADS
ncbi:MAG: SpoIIE family protein phosphatase, partial [Gallionella sp.]|nr:SpoIIE family protein phosphatase [Gallionella sp.]